MLHLNLGCGVPAQCDVMPRVSRAGLDGLSNQAVRRRWLGEGTKRIGLVCMHRESRRGAALECDWATGERERWERERERESEMGGGKHEARS